MCSKRKPRPKANADRVSQGSSIERLLLAERLLRTAGEPLEVDLTLCAGPLPEPLGPPRAEQPRPP